jgi:outer membrane protein insertion porin family/translocation and assembly module TamA
MLRADALLVIAFGSALVGCRPDRVAVPTCPANDESRTGCVVDELELVGADAVPASDIEARLAMAASSHPLGGALESVPILGIIDRLTTDYERFDRFVLERDLARVERAYRARGFYDARVRAGRVVPLANGHVRVEIVVTEGKPVKVGSVELVWKDWCPTDPKLSAVTRAVTNAKNELAVGTPLVEATFEGTKKSILRAMIDRGFAFATVSGHADVDLGAHAATVRYTLELGPHARFGPVRFTGLERHDPATGARTDFLVGAEAPLRRSLGFDTGDPFSQGALDSAQYALTDFGVFSSVELAPDLSARPAAPAKACDARPTAAVPVDVRVQVAKLRTVKLGIGAEAGWQVEGHGLAGWEDRNFIGGLRHFVAEAKGGPVLYPTRLDTLFSAPPSRVLPQLKLRTELSQPAFWRTTLHFAGSFNLYRLQPTTGSTDASQPVYKLDLGAPSLTKFEPNIIGYREYTGRTGLDRSFTRWRHYLGLFYNLQLFSPFSYNEPDAPVGYSNVLVPYAELVGTLDFRRGASGAPDRIHPHSGAWLSVDGQLASGASQNANDVRVRPEVRGYVAISKRVTLASRLAFGFLFPRNYGSELAGANASTPAECHDLQLLQLRGFFSGGPYSNRGYGYNEVGPHVTATCSAQVSTVNQSTASGGLSMWEASTELRVPIGVSFGTAFFVDASDVSPCEGLVRVTHPHLSTGFGLRYDTPVGPLRADVGYRVPGAQAFDAKLGCARDLPDYEPQPVLGLPIAVSIAIGEAF